MAYIKNIYTNKKMPVNEVMESEIIKNSDYKSFCNNLGKLNRSSINNYLNDFKEDNLFIKERMNLICAGSLYDKLKNEIYNNIMIYFNKYKNELEKNSFKYQIYKIKKTISSEKFEYYDHIHYFDNKDMISIPSNCMYYTIVINYIIDTIFKAYDLSRIRNKEYITPIFKEPNEININ